MANAAAVSGSAQVLMIPCVMQIPLWNVQQCRLDELQILL